MELQHATAIVPWKPTIMYTDRNLLFAVLALQADLIDSREFVEACSLWTSRKNVPIAELLIERGWIQPADRVHVDYLLERKLQKHGGNTRASLASVSNDVKRSLAALEDTDIQCSLADIPEADASESGATIDHVSDAQQRYTLACLHATGGIGRIWEARDNQLGRNVALKELRPERAGNAVLWERFLREAQITGQLEHPGIVPVYELSRRPDDGHPFYTMRLIKGRTLTEAARDYQQERHHGHAAPLKFLALLNAFVSVCNTVAYAHSRGVIHRDLKGHNVVLGDFGEVVILDWGLAKLMGRAEDEPEVPAVAFKTSESSEANLTVQGQTLGTPSYMAPEQAAGRVDLIDCRTDVYGLGAILYEILTGQPPFAGPEIRDVLRRVQEEPPIPPGQLNPEAPPALEVVCLHALAKKPSDRFASASELAQQVQQWQEVQRRQAEDALHQQTRILHSILDSMADGVCVADRQGKFILFNRAAERIMGIGLSDAPPAQWSEQYRCYHSDGVTQFPAEDLPLARAIRGEESDGVEIRIRNPNFPEDPLLSVNGRPFKDDDGVLQGGSVVFRDITAQKRAEDALRESEVRYRSVVTTMKEGIVLFAADGNILACNASAEQILGLSAQQILKRSARDPRWQAIRADGTSFPEDEFPAIITLRTGEPCRDIVIGVHKPDGTLTWISTNTQPLFREQQKTPYAVICSFSDITYQKRLEGELRRARAEVDRLRMATHEGRDS
jgi:PAS domain S-box-containing protein